MSPVRRTWSLLLVALVVLQPAFLTGCSSQSPDKRILQYLNTEGFGKRYYGNASEENYVTIGDAISFADTYNLELRGVARVDIDGTIQLPEAGAVFVAGLTRTELESYLTQKLSPYFLQTDVRVTMETGPGKVYYVVGEVDAAPVVPFSGDLTLFEAVMLARPREFSANLGRVRVIRADPRDPLVITVDLPSLWEDGDATYNLQIQEFDIIYVPPTFIKDVADLAGGVISPFVQVFAQLFRLVFFFEGRGGGVGRTPTGIF